MVQYPINHYFIMPEDSKNPHLLSMGQDYYHKLSKLSLEQHIQRAKSILSGAYCSGNFHDENHSDDIHDEVLTSKFSEAYQIVFNNLKEGHSASSCENYIFQFTSPIFQSNFLKKSFPMAMTWALCADLLFQAGFKENAWSALIEYKKCELRTEDALKDEYELSISNRNKDSGSKSYQQLKHLKFNLIELLETYAPEKGWQAVKKAASTLAPIVLERHMNSSNSSRFHISLEEVEKKLSNWIYTDKQCKEKYQAFKNNTRPKE